MNADDFNGLPAAIASMPTGGDLFLTARNYFIPDTLVIAVPNLTLRGESTLGSELIPPDPKNPNHDVVRIESDGVTLRDLSVQGNANTVRPFHGIVARGSGVSRLYLENLLIQDMGGKALLIEDVLSATALNVEVTDNHAEGIVVARASGTMPWTIRLLACYSASNSGTGIVLDGHRAPTGPEVPDSTVLSMVGMENIGHLDENDAVNEVWLLIKDVSGVQFLAGAYFEGRREPGIPDQFILASGVRGLVIDGAWFTGKGPGGERIRHVARFEDSEAIVFSNNSGWDWSEAMVVFAGSVDGFVELGNRASPSVTYLTGKAPEYEAGEAVIFGLSQGALQPFGYPTAPTNPTPVTGSIRWVGSPGELQVFDGTVWKPVSFE